MLTWQKTLMPKKSECINMALPLRTDRLYIRRFRPQDGESLAEILTDPAVTYFEPYDTFSYDKALGEAENLSKSDEFFAVVHKETNRVIGKLYFHNCEFDTWEIGWTLRADCQGKGLAFESVSVFLQHVFQNALARKVIAKINGRNIKSQNLAYRLGMLKEGCLRKYGTFYKDPYGNAIWDDMWIFGLFADELNI